MRPCAQTQSRPPGGTSGDTPGTLVGTPNKEELDQGALRLGVGALRAKNFLKLSLLSVAKGLSHLPTHHLPVSDAEGDASYSWGLWQPYGETSSALTLSPEGQASLPWILEASMTALTYKRGWK